MTRFLVCAAIATAVGVVSAAGQQQPVFRGTGDAVRVFVTVTDRDGRLVTTLTQNDFDVRDEGKPQPITLFDNTPQPIRLIVMLDVSRSMEGNLPLLRASVEELIPRLRRDDRVRIGTFGHQVDIGPWMGRADAPDSALPDRIAPDAPTPLWRAIDEAMDALGEKGAEKGDERRVVLVLSDGRDGGPTGFRQRFSSQAGVIDRARTEDVMVYAIGMRSRPARPMTPGLGAGGLQAALTADLPDPGLGRVAEETGGGYTEVRFGQDLAAAFARVADELHSQYLIGFAPPRRDGKKHDVEVRVSQRGLTARGRKSYVAPTS